MNQIFTQRDNSLFCSLSGERLLIEPWGRNGLRVRACIMHDLEESNAGLEGRGEEKADIRIEENEASIRNGNILARLQTVCGGGEIRLRFENGRGELLLQEINPDNALRKRARHFKARSGDDYRLKVSFEADEEEKIYGMGQYQQEKMNLKGCNLELAHRNSQASIPYYISSRGYGFFWNNAAVGEVHFGTNTTEWVAECTRQMDYWITAADTPLELIEAYAQVTGKAPVMPEYGLGLWQCKLRYYSQEDVLRVAREYHRRKIPVDMIIIDYFHWLRCGDFRFEDEFFPDPEGMIAELNGMGMKTMISVWPQVDLQSENFGQMSRHGMLVKSRSGVAIQMIHTGYHVFADMTNPETREYVWEKIKKNYADKGVVSFWLDEAEPEFATYDYENYSYYSGSVEQTGNIYPREFSRLFYEGQRAMGQQEIVNLVRCAWAGSQKYGALVWSGDISCTFEDFRRQICAGLHMGIAGIPWWTTDIGGFQGARTEDPAFHELLTRWFQFAAFCPVMRMHGSRMPYTSVKAEDGSERRHTGADNELWSFGEEVYEILKFYVAVRERLRPYTRKCMEEAHVYGRPVMRAAFLEFPQDAACWNLTDQYLFGEDLLVAPVVYAGAKKRDVYLPCQEQWVDLWTGEEYEGGQIITVDAPLEKLPLFARKSSETIDELKKLVACEQILF